jgi:hypothetical protein
LTRIRKIAAAFVLVPLALVCAALAVANRQPVLVSFDPFDQAHPAYTLSIPLFALLLCVVLAGVVIGGVAAWLGQRKWRRAARLAQGHARELREELNRARPRPLEVVPAPPTRATGTALIIPPPAA